MAEVYFKTNTLLKSLVGKDLINDDNIAVVELVKNSFDANSSSVLVQFEGLDSNAKTNDSSRLLIIDHGDGMSLKDIKEKWLNIAYSEKKYADTEKGSFLAGNKGIGRLSCDRLGENLDMITRSEEGALQHLNVDWTKFEIEGNRNLTIQDIPINLTKITDQKAKSLIGLDIPRTGTALVITNLRSVWDKDKLFELKRMLEKFLNPNQLFQRKKFKIELSVPDLKSSEHGKNYQDKINCIVQNQIFKNLRFKTTYIESSIDKTGEFINTELSHEGEIVFKLTERNTNYPKLKSIAAVIYYLNPYKKAYFKRQTGKRLLDFGSIFLFLNGFRVAPYGDRGDDWLGLDVRKTQGTSRYLGSRDLVGRIEVDDPNNVFIPVSSREGLKDTPEFAQLKEKYFLDILRKLEKFVVDGLDWDSIPKNIRNELRKEEGLDWKKTAEKYNESWDKKRQRILLSIITLIGISHDRLVKFWFNPSLLDDVHEQRTEDVKKLLDEIEGFDDSQVEHDLKKNLKKIGAILAKKTEEAAVAKRETANLRTAVEQKNLKIEKLEKESDTYRAQTLFLQSVSSLDIKNLLSYHHQICLDSSIIENYIGQIIKLISKDNPNKILLDKLEKIIIANKRVLATAQFATKANFSSAAKKEITDIPSFFEQYIMNVAKDFVAAGLRLNIENNVKEPFEVKARRIELSILIDNLISNSVKAFAKSLTIKINKKDNNYLTITFKDDGRGLSSKISKSEEIFEMGVTSTTGSGIGLYHSKQIMESMDGNISVEIDNNRKLKIALGFMR